MNKKCPYCGFINFVQAEACRKCETVLTYEHGPSAYDRPAVYRGGVDANRQTYDAKSGFTFGKALICFAGLVFGASVYLWAVRPHVLAFFAAKCQWTEYRPAGVDFTVTMPNKPRILDPLVVLFQEKSLTNHRFISEVGGQGVAGFAFIDYTGTMLDLAKSEQLLNDELNDFVKRTDSTLISKKITTYYGMPAIEFESTPPEKTFPKNSRNYGRFFLNSTRLYMLVITGVEGSELLAGKDKFLNPRLEVSSK